MTRPPKDARPDEDRLKLLAMRIESHIQAPSAEGKHLLSRHLLCESCLLGIDRDLLREILAGTAKAARREGRAGA